MANFETRNFGKWASKTISVDAAIIDKARKVYALVLRGATDGEKSAALSRFTSIALTAGVSVENLEKVM